MTLGVVPREGVSELPRPCTHRVVATITSAVNRVEDGLDELWQVRTVRDPSSKSYLTVNDPGYGFGRLPRIPMRTSTVDTVRGSTT